MPGPLSLSPGRSVTSTYSPPTSPQTAAPDRGGAPQLTLPDRPRLAPGIRLAGQMHESAFKEPPWLIEREGAGYVQVTALLYRTAEQCTGANTFDGIAANLTAAGLP